MSSPRDRRAKLATQTALNGIDFVEVLDAAQTHLRVHFLNQAPGAATLAAAVTHATITGGDTVATVDVLPLTAASWDTRAGRPTLDLFVAAPGDFSTYVLTLVSRPVVAPALDRFFDHVEFSFKAGCPSTLDCRQPPIDCPPPADAAPPIDYLAKDFESFRKALSDFSALRYPAWQERSEADFGVMFMEALASVADDLSYQQDRIASEAWLETATQRRSLVRLGRLVDYEPTVAVAARTLLQFEVAVAKNVSIPAGLPVSALAADGASIEFETGTSLADPTAYLVDASWNTMQPHWWDDDQRCLRRGATEMWIERPGRQLAAGQLLLIDTTAEPPADPPRREIVLLTSVADADDLLYGTPLSRITWRAEDALKTDHDLTRTTVGANLVPATQGRRHIDNFVVSSTWSPVPGPPRAILRTGANGTPQFLHTLRHAPLAWLAQADPTEDPRPEIRVVETSSGEPVAWQWHRSLLGAGEFEPAVTVDPMRYRTVDAAIGAADYDGADGATLRFGDGVFGAIPGDDTAFEVTYRAGGGSRGNVAAGAITRVDAAHPAAVDIVAVFNPLAASGGRDEEPDDQVREMAPQRFRAQQYRAVRAEDYERAAMTLPWVQRAGTQFRYTGSWLSVFTAVDPQGSESLPPDSLLDLTNVLDRYRLAGYEAFGLAPRYASLDLDITVCARSDAFRGDVARGVLATLGAARHPDGTRGFFHPDRFTFGLPLERSAIEAAVQEVPGVAGVIDVRYRRRGHTPGFIVMPDAVEVAADEIVRVDNEPSRPERGSLRVNVRGGK
ncbi:MAG TPA: baseplate J/gp47 family protein [Vicinamibacterales bacterium]|nr:baseplate J/gp47 family protein [Vicinamibacterales bacterium]